MRLFLLSLFFVFLSSASFAQQRISGRITDTEGNAVEYVNVGIADTSLGVISDARGNFLLRLPDSLAGRNILFSHLSYGVEEVPAEELILRTASGEEVVVCLPESGHTIPEIVVRPGRIRHRRIGSGGIRVPLPTYWVISGSPDGSVDKTVKRLPELGSVLNIKDPLLIEELFFSVNSCTDSLLVRFNFYSIADDSVFTPIHHVPFYTMIRPSKNQEDYSIDISDGLVIAPVGKILVTMQQVESYGEATSIGMPAYWGEAYARDAFHADFAKTALHLGLQVYGRILAD